MEVVRRQHDREAVTEVAVGTPHEDTAAEVHTDGYSGVPTVTLVCIHDSPENHEGVLPGASSGCSASGDPFTRQYVPDHIPTPDPEEDVPAAAAISTRAMTDMRCSLEEKWWRCTIRTLRTGLAAALLRASAMAVSRARSRASAVARSGIVAGILRMSSRSAVAVRSSAVKSPGVDVCVAASYFQLTPWGMARGITHTRAAETKTTATVS